MENKYAVDVTSLLRNVSTTDMGDLIKSEERHTYKVTIKESVGNVSKEKELETSDRTLVLGLLTEFKQLETKVNIDIKKLRDMIAVSERKEINEAWERATKGKNLV